LDWFTLIFEGEDKNQDWKAGRLEGWKRLCRENTLFPLFPYTFDRKLIILVFSGFLMEGEWLMLKQDVGGDSKRNIVFS